MQQKSTVTSHHKGKYFRTQIPRDIAIDVLGLKTDIPKQQLEWKIKKGRVVVEKSV